MVYRRLGIDTTELRIICACMRAGHAVMNISSISPQYGDTPLHPAAYRGHIEVVQLLLMSHANLNIKNNVSIESP